MRSHRILSLVAIIVLLGAVVAAVAVMTVTVLPAALALGLAVLALIAGAGAGLRRRPGRRARTTPVPAALKDGVVAGSGASPGRRWVVQWDSRPPVTALHEARERVAVVLAGWGLTGEAVEPTLLVVTELLSNAVEHGRGPGWLSLAFADESVRVEVRDDVPEPPSLRARDPLRVRGRGLQLVEAVASRWGVTDDPPGKVVWAEVGTRWPD
jgi:anti-sigma regulatory factor (Ser/Thr protein kinase)